LILIVEYLPKTCAKLAGLVSGRQRPDLADSHSSRGIAPGEVEIGVGSVRGERREAALLCFLGQGVLESPMRRQVTTYKIRVRRGGDGRRRRDVLGWRHVCLPDPDVRGGDRGLHRHEVEANVLTQWTTACGGRLILGVRIVWVERPLSEIAHCSPSAIEQTQALAGLLMLQDGLVAAEHLLIAGLPFAGVVKGAVFVPGVVVAVLMTGAGRGEDEDIVRGARR
jgi:hypothetical protein